MGRPLEEDAASVVLDLVADDRYARTAVNIAGA